MIKLIKYIPAIFFFITWLSLLSQGQSIKYALTLPLNNQQFLSSMGSAIDNPWSHNAALRVLFKKLMHDQASPIIWRNAAPFANAIWQQYQYDGSIEILLATAHASNNTLEEIYWATIYQKIHSDLRNDYLKHALIGHARGEALKLSREW